MLKLNHKNHITKLYFGSLVFMFVGNFFASPNTEAHAFYEKAFSKNAEKFLKEKVYYYITYGRYFPQILRDFGIYYPKYDVPFDHIACISHVKLIN